MARQLIVLSGAIGSGKSTLAQRLAERYGASLITTREIVAERMTPGGRREGLSRERLQRRGQRLDTELGGAWLVEGVSGRVEGLGELVVIDSARTTAQVESLREAFPRVTHVHLKASLGTLEARYRSRESVKGFTEAASYDIARSNRTERGIDQLETDADICIDTDTSDAEMVLVRAATRLGLLSAYSDRLVDVLVGGQYGSEGKGNISAYLSSEYELLVRSGGPNAGHTVPLTTGSHVQHHLPSGARRSEAKLLLAPGAVVNVRNLLKEISESQVDSDRLKIDPQAMVITDEHIAEEQRLVEEIGSTGQGVGAASAARIWRKLDTVLAKDVPELKPYLADSHEILERAFAAGHRVFVEGTQGTGLSLLHGRYPHVTSRDTTVSGLLAEAGIPPSRVRRTIMVCRTYPIRVKDPDTEGKTSGYIFHETSWEEVSQRSGLDLEELKKQELTSTTRKQRRVGEFDWTLLQRAAQLNGPTDIALTFVDQLSSKNIDARRYDQLADETIRFIEEVEGVAQAPVSLISTRFHVRSIIDRRTWVGADARV